MYQIIIGLVLGFGFYFIIAGMLKIPFLKTSIALLNISKKGNQKISVLKVWQTDFINWLSRHLHLNEYKRLQLESDIKSAGLTITPEQHISTAVVKAGIYGLLAIPAYFIFPLISPLIVAIAFTVYFKESKSIQDKIKARRAAIEYELPRLVSTIEKTLCHSRDVLAILDDYRERADDILKQELSITVADMRSGNYELALTRLDARVGSIMMSDVVRGLISVLRGDDTVIYWQSLSIRFADIQKQQLKLQAQKVPGKVKRLSMVLLFCFISMYAVVIIVQIMDSLGALFA